MGQVLSVRTASNSVNMHPTILIFAFNPSFTFSSLRYMALSGSKVRRIELSQQSQSTFSSTTVASLGFKHHELMMRGVRLNRVVHTICPSLGPHPWSSHIASKHKHFCTSSMSLQRTASSLSLPNNDRNYLKRRRSPFCSSASRNCPHFPYILPLI